MVSLEIGSRVNVPHNDAQGLVIGRNTTSSFSLIGAMPIDYVALRYVSGSGVTVDQTFSLSAIDRANPPPVDVAALTLDVNQLTNRVQELQRKLAERASRKSKSKKRKR